MAGNEKNRPLLMRFPSAFQSDLLKARNSRYRKIILQLLQDLELLEYGKALRVPLSELPDCKENVRSALNRAAGLRGMTLATSGDSDYLYVWKLSVEPNESNMVVPAFTMAKAAAEVSSIEDSPKLAVKTWPQAPRQTPREAGGISSVFNKTAAFGTDGKKKSRSQKGGEVLEELA